MNDSSPSQSLGDFLRSEREKRGLTIEQVASATKIGVKNLHYLETDQYSLLPARPFVRGFVLAYCQFIGLKGNEVLTRYGDFIVRKSEDRPSRDAGHSGYAFEKKEGEQSKTILWVTLGSFLVVGALGVLLLKPKIKHKKMDALEKLNLRPAEGELPTPTPSPSGETAEGERNLPQVTPSTSPTPVTSATPTPKPSPTPKASASPKASPTPSPSPKTTPKPKASPAPAATPATNTPDKADPLNSGVNIMRVDMKHKLIIKAGQDQWVRYQVDDKPFMKFILRKDRILVLRAKEKVIFQSSQPDHVNINYNSGGLKPLTSFKNAHKKDKDLTLFYPAQLAESIEKPFDGENSINGAHVPLPWRPDAQQPIEQ